MEPITKLRARPENQLTPEEHDAAYGPGTSGVMLYRLHKHEDGHQSVVARTFPAGTMASEEWRDSPAAFGVITAPSLDQRPNDAFDAVFATPPPAAAAEPVKRRA